MSHDQHESLLSGCNSDGPLVGHSGSTWGSPKGVVFLGACTVALLTLITLDKSPTVWQDEVQIVDFGRCLFDPATDWALTTLPNGQPHIIRYPVYVSLQRAWVTLFGATPFTVRSFSLLCAVAATFVLYLFLNEARVSSWFSAFIVLAFLCDPLFVRSYRGGRGDALAICFSLLAAVVGMRGLRTGSRSHLLLTGILVVVSFLTWPTAAVLLAGLAIVVLVCSKLDSWRKCVLALMHVLVGIVVAGLIYVIFTWPLLNRMYAEGVLPLGKRCSLQLPNLSTLAALTGHHKLTPWVPALWGVALLMGLVKQTAKSLLLLLGVAIAIVGANLVPPFYSWRVMYVCPLLYAASAIALARGGAWRQYAACSVFALSVVATLGVRTVVAFQEQDCRSYERYGEAICKIIPDGAVVMGGWDYYYIGLQHGWKMFTDGPLTLIAQRYSTVYVVRDQAGMSSAWGEKFDYEMVGAYRSTRQKNHFWFFGYSEARCYRAWVYRCTPRKGLSKTERDSLSTRGALRSGTLCHPPITPALVCREAGGSISALP